MRRSPVTGCYCSITAVVLRRVGARQRGWGAAVEGARILAFVLTIPFGGCEPHVRGWGLPVFWGWARGVGEAENKIRMVYA